MEINLILNWLMPVLIVSFFVGILYIILKEPADIFFGWVGRGIIALLNSGKDKATESVEVGTELVFD